MSSSKRTFIRPGLRALVAASALWLGACETPLPPASPTPLLERALATHARDLDTRKFLHEMHVRNDWRGIEQFASVQLKLDPGSEDGLLLLSYARLQQKRPADALESLLQLTRLHPEEIDGWNLLAEAQRQTGRLEQALQTLTQASSIDPSSAVSPFLLGEIHRDRGRPDLAVNAYRAAVQLEPGMNLAWYGLAMALRQLGRNEEYAKAVEALKELDPGMATRLATDR